MATRDVSTSIVQSKGKFWTLRRIEISWGYLFILPWIIGFLLFTLFPMIASFYLSLTDYTYPGSTAAIKCCNFANYDRAIGIEFKIMDSPTADATKVLDPGYLELARVYNVLIGARDPQVYKSLVITLSLAIVSLPVSIICGLMIAVMLNTRIRGVNIFRTLIYSPTIVPVVAAASIFQQLLGGQYGWINRFLANFGIQGPDWLNQAGYTIPSLVIVGLWGVGSGMVIYLSGLQSVPTELHEAARVDGAGTVTRFFRITLPMISPVILYQLVLGLIGSFQYFATAFVIYGRAPQTGPDASAYFFNLYLYKTAFPFNQMGYASALGWVLFGIVMIITLIVFRTSGSWVFYAGARRS